MDAPAEHVPRGIRQAQRLSAFHSPAEQKHDLPEGMILQSSTPACEGDSMRAVARERGHHPDVPPKKNRSNLWEYDKTLYRRRNKGERFFQRIRRFRRIMTCCDKLDIVFAGCILFAMIIDSIV